MITHFTEKIIHFWGDICQDSFQLEMILSHYALNYAHLICNESASLDLEPSFREAQDPSPGTLCAGRTWEGAVCPAFG